MEFTPETTPKELYNHQSKEYDTFCADKFQNYLVAPHIHSLVGNLQGKKILDLACGQGLHLKLLSKHNPSQIMGVDISDAMIQRARDNVQHPNASFLVEDISNPQLYEMVGENQFDIVVSSWTAYYMENREKLKYFFNNAYKSLVRGGTAFIYLQEDPVTYSSGVGKICGIEMEFVSGPWKEKLEDLTVIKKVLSGEFVLHNYFWNYETMEEVLREVGFSSVKKDCTYDDSEGLKAFNEGEWALIKKYHPFYVVVATK